jgi:hypothetical protein
MQHVFYFFAIFSIIYEILCLSAPKKTHEYAKRLNLKKGGDISGYDVLFVGFNLLTLIWMIAGLMSSQWVSFATLIVLTFTIGFISKYHWVIRMLSGIIYLAILVFIVHNKYHLGIDVAGFILTLIN